MKKTLRPPESWPPEGCQLYWDFQRHMTQRVKSVRQFFLVLHGFLNYQAQLGLAFREFPQATTDAYIEAQTPHNRRTIASALRVWTRFLFARKALLVAVHEEIPRPPAPRTRRKLLSHDQVLQLLQLPWLDEPCGLRDRTYLEMAYGSGLRPAESAALDIADVDLNAGQVHIGDPKNSYQRIVPLTGWTLHFLRRYLEEARPQLSTPLSPSSLWLNAEGKRAHVSLVNSRLEKVYRARERLGFSVTVYQLRHACATHMLTAGADLREVQELLGHRVLQSTQTYTHITPSTLLSVHERCHPRNNGSMPDAGTESP